MRCHIRTLNLHVILVMHALYFQIIYKYFFLKNCILAPVSAKMASFSTNFYFWTSTLFLESGSDSDNEGVINNISRLVLRPPGHTGKAKKGFLCFDSLFEGGNLGRVDFISEYEYDLFLRPDTCNPRNRMWFNFIVDNTRDEQVTSLRFFFACWLWYHWI